MTDCVRSLWLHVVEYEHLTVKDRKMHTYTMQRNITTLPDVSLGWTLETGARATVRHQKPRWGKWIWGHCKYISPHGTELWSNESNESLIINLSVMEETRLSSGKTLLWGRTCFVSQPELLLPCFVGSFFRLCLLKALHRRDNSFTVIFKCCLDLVVSCGFEIACCCLATDTHLLLLAAFQPMSPGFLQAKHSNVRPSHTC